MNPFAVIPLLCFFICVFVAAFVFFRDSKSLANRLYVALSVAMSLQALIEFGYRQSQNFTQASFWWHIDLIWPLSPPLLVLFVLALAGKNAWVRNRVVLLFLLGPALGLSIIDGTTHVITGPPIKQMWGWSYGLPQPNPFYFAGYAWIILHCFAALSIGVWALVHADRPEKRGQLSLTLLGVIVVVAGALTEPLMKTVDVKMPPFYVTSLIVGNLFVSYAIWKYKLFQLSPSSVASDIVETMTDALFLVRPDGRIAATNRAAGEMFQTDLKYLIGVEIENLFAQGSSRPYWLMKAPPIASADSAGFETTNDLETAFVADGKEIHVSLAGNVQRGKGGELIGYLLIARDVTERRRVSMELSKYKDRLEELIEHRTQELLQTNDALKKQIQERILAEDERAKLEAQLHQSQKMEAIGRLAGGVAHDFNNLLTVITTYSDLIMLSVGEDDPIREDLCEIREATRRATALTQQLLTFSRKQVVEPKLIDLNVILTNAEKMLGRIIGEDVNLIVSPHPEPLCARLDPVQLEQVLANLVVNARDAMPFGGQIIASSRQVRLCAEDCLGIPEASEGEYTVLSVQDTGCGMNEETLTHIFEPFFTTKEKGKGTGLGLSTVYGIVKQNRGFIRVDTAPGRGTTFDVYLPRVEGVCEITQRVELQPLPPAEKTGETILLVEDEDIVRRLTCNVLQKQGYKVFEANDAARARQILAQCRERIDLLLTDVVMPGQNGKQLSEEVRSFYPHMRVLFMSGYNDEIIDQHGLLHPGIHLIQKPFSSQGLSRKVREVLEAGGGPSAHQLQ